MKRIFDTVAIVGPGLIGGSMGRAILDNKLAGHVTGIGRRESSLQKAVEVGAVDSATTDLGAGTECADLIVLATPVSTFGGLAARLAGLMKGGAVLTEVGSSKQSVIEAVGQGLGGRDDVPFIPTHPMAGSEQSGAENASPDLFKGATCIFTPLDNTPAEAVERLKLLWEALGAEVHFLTPRQHDRLVARISHMPHLVAAALINTIAKQEGAYAGGGLVDTTRVAGGDPQLWEAICQSNTQEIVEAIDAFSTTLEYAKKFIADGDFDSLGAWLAEAKKKREEILELRKNFSGER